ncbi:MAG TPA: histidine phosphatase family protein [Burkholderiaceae bacterium]|nr:histidine phosphatase family protein [Burkholderiaceae bacterium]
MKRIFGSRIHMIGRAARDMSTALRIAASLALALCTQAAPAQTQVAPRHDAASAPALSSMPDPHQRLQGAALVRALREGGLVIYFRHTATDFSKSDRDMRDYEDCANQRPLTEQGRRDAIAIGQRIAELKLPIGVVKASPMCRTMEHAKLMLGMATPTHTMRELTDGEYSGLKRLLSMRVPAGINRWMVGHGNPFRAVAGPPQLAEGEAVVLRPSGDGWVVVARLSVADWAALRG